MAKRPCPKADCPTLINPSDKYCPTHQQESDAARGTTTQRGYGHEHQVKRARWAAILRARAVPCARCGQPINPGEPWDLGHNDDDRTKYNGPEHANKCNRSAGGKRAHLYN